MRTDNHTYYKTSIYLRDDIKEKMNELTPHGKQTSFINETLAVALKNIEREMLRQELLEELRTIKPKKVKGKTARQTLEQVRKQRDKQLLRNLKK